MCQQKVREKEGGEGANTESQAVAQAAGKRCPQHPSLVGTRVTEALDLVASSEEGKKLGFLWVRCQALHEIVCGDMHTCVDYVAFLGYERAL